MDIKQNILLTTDTALITITLSILLIQRKNDPFKGKWALPGGFVEDDEDLNVGAARELEEETSVSIHPEQLIQFKAFGTPGRDPRGRTVSVVFFAMVSAEILPAASDDAQDARWFDLANLPDLAFDHEQIINELLIYWQS